MAKEEQLRSSCNFGRTRRRSRRAEKLLRVAEPYEVAGQFCGTNAAPAEVQEGYRHRVEAAHGCVTPGVQDSLLMKIRTLETARETSMQFKCFIRSQKLDHANVRIRLLQSGDRSKESKES